MVEDEIRIPQENLQNQNIMILIGKIENTMGLSYSRPSRKQSISETGKLIQQKNLDIKSLAEGN